MLMMGVCEAPSYLLSKGEEEGKGREGEGG